MYFNNIMLIETDITGMTDTTGIINSVVSLKPYFICTCGGIYSQDRCEGVLTMGEGVLTMEKARRLGRKLPEIWT